MGNASRRTQLVARLASQETDREELAGQVIEHPGLLPFIKALLKVEDATYQTPECRNVALGHVITAFDQLFDQITRKRAVLQLVTRQLANRRAATRKKAEKFLRKRHADSRKKAKGKKEMLDS